MDIVTIADTYTSHAKEITKKAKNRQEKLKESRAALYGTWGSITKMVRLGAVKTLLVA